MNTPILPLIVCAALALAIVISLLWVARDARRRGRSSIRIALLCLIFWPLGFLIWCGVRPPPLSRP